MNPYKYIRPKGFYKPTKTRRIHFNYHEPNERYPREGTGSDDVVSEWLETLHALELVMARAEDDAFQRSRQRIQRQRTIMKTLKNLLDPDKNYTLANAAPLLGMEESSLRVAVRGITPALPGQNALYRGSSFLPIIEKRLENAPIAAENRRASLKRTREKAKAKAKAESEAKAARHEAPDEVERT